MTENDLLLAGGIWVACSVVAWWIATTKKAPDAGQWAVWGFLLGPIGLVMAATAKAPQGPAVVCANCGKTVARDRARLCNHCGEPFAA